MSIDYQKEHVTEEWTCKVYVHTFPWCIWPDLGMQWGCRRTLLDIVHRLFPEHLCLDRDHSTRNNCVLLLSSD